ncbi:SRPBCC family protein [Agrococcus jenensis]|uniref:Uncharacterized protein YndB with AHSA1/START domain n=1 Tax=Agrococcus jenensis TaxID=46353 RepID=A0A3N2AQ45_9MICO|nr:SRPBCC family protein [Agrococcus jenensis]ROR65038.1 uncharacterized protein YndB with AHSA1/START domain [Agrococcus jenensis]
MALDSEHDGGQRVEVTGFVAATTDAVWALWTTADGLRQWWWPQFDDTRYEVDAQEGGWYRIRTAEGGIGVQGTYVELLEGERIVQTWDWLGGDGTAATQLVTVELEELDGGTLVRVTQTGPADELEQLEQGWSDILTRLEELLDD